MEGKTEVVFPPQVLIGLFTGMENAKVDWLAAYFTRLESGNFGVRVYYRPVKDETFPDVQQLLQQEADGLMDAHATEKHVEESARLIQEAEINAKKMAEEKEIAPKSFKERDLYDLYYEKCQILPECEACDEVVATLQCANCEQTFCRTCSTQVHKIGANKTHNPAKLKGKFQMLIRAHSKGVRRRHLQRANRAKISHAVRNWNRAHAANGVYALRRHGEQMRALNRATMRWKARQTSAAWQSLVMRTL